MHTRLRLIRLVCASFAASSFALGGWMVWNPSGFWDWVGLTGGEPVVQAIYGGAILGEGAMLALCARDPARYLVILQYLVFYKTAACFAALFALSRADSPPVGAYIVVAAWAIAGIIPAIVYPWGRESELLERDDRSRAERTRA